MSRKICRRKHWAPVNPITLAISGATITPEESLDKLRLLELAALESFARDKATPHDFRALCDMLNVCETMAEMGIGPEALDSCRKTQAALLRAKDRFEAAGRFGFSRTDMKAARDLYEFHDLQRTAVDRSTYERAIKRTADKIRGASPKVKVLA